MSAGWRNWSVPGPNSLRHVAESSDSEGGTELTALVVGFGSIGMRHHRVLTDLGCSVSVVSAREVPVTPRYGRVEEAIAAGRPGYVVVANATSEHAATVSTLADAGFSGVLLVEKPVVARTEERLPPLSGPAYVGYNLRFHPLVSRLRDELEGERVLSVHAYVGQYLPDWRPGSDYRQSYSSSRARGGGVLRDLSHELDYLTWLFGGWSAVVASGGRVSTLEIDSDDTFGVLLETPRCPVLSLQLNYLDRVARRRVIVNTTGPSWEVDLIRGTLARNGEVEHVEVGRDHTYIAMHHAILRAGGADACTLDEGLRTVALVEAIEHSAATRAWVGA